MRAGTSEYQTPVPRCASLLSQCVRHPLLLCLLRSPQCAQWWLHLLLAGWPHFTLCCNVHVLCHFSPLIAMSVPVQLCTLAPTFPYSLLLGHTHSYFLLRRHLWPCLTATLPVRDASSGSRMMTTSKLQILSHSLPIVSGSAFEKTNWKLFSCIKCFPFCCNIFVKVKFTRTVAVVRYIRKNCWNCVQLPLHTSWFLPIFLIFTKIKVLKNNIYHFSWMLVEFYKVSFLWTFWYEQNVFEILF